MGVSARSVSDIDRHQIVVPPVGLNGILVLPRPSRALVVFAHGSGSGRLSPRNTCVANALTRGWFAGHLAPAQD